MKVVGLTGGIAMGKSTVSSYLQQLGATIIDADQITHQLQSRGTQCYQEIVTMFGTSILQANADLDRRKLGKLVFSDSHKLKQLVMLMDPYIRQTITNKIRQHRNDSIIVLDAPTLFENGYQYLADVILVVRCGAVAQLNRLRQRNHLSIAAASQRIASQWPIEIKAQLADYIIDSDGSISQTEGQVLEWWNKILD